MKKKYSAVKVVPETEENDNPGLDADGSSTGNPLYDNLNNDNDRISGNPDGEDDDHDTPEPPGSSPIEEK